MAHYLHVMHYFLVVAQLVKAVKCLAADVTYQRVEIGLVIVYSRFSLVHA